MIPSESFNLIDNILNGILDTIVTKLYCKNIFDICSDSDEEELLSLKKQEPSSDGVNLSTIDFDRLAIMKAEVMKIFSPKIIDADDSDSEDDYITDKRKGRKKPGHNFNLSEIPVGSVFDSHCHFEFIQRRLKWRTNLTLSRCLELDGLCLGDRFRGCIVNFCQPSEWSGGPDQSQVSSLLQVTVSDARLGVSIGCHPHFASQMNVKRWSQLELLLSSPDKVCPGLRAVSLGECGLDYSKKNNCDKQVQIQVFKRQLKLAMKYNLPLVLHIRDAEEDGLRALEEVRLPRKYLIHRHCFGGNAAAAKTWLAKYHNSKIGVTGWVTYPHAKDVVNVIRETNLDRILLETDAPYFVPASLSGDTKLSLPGHVIHVATKVAQIKV